MKSTFIETERAGNPFWAVLDANRRNIANQSHFTQLEQVAAERMALGLDLVYGHKGIFINYRETFIAIKVNNPTIKDRKNLRLLEADYVAKGITKRESNQGIIYRIKKA